jgi:hypothetical protein
VSLLLFLVLNLHPILALSLLVLNPNLVLARLSCHHRHHDLLLLLLCQAQLDIYIKVSVYPSQPIYIFI